MFYFKFYSYTYDDSHSISNVRETPRFDDRATLIRVFILCTPPPPLPPREKSVENGETGRSWKGWRAHVVELRDFLMMLPRCWRRLILMFILR